MLKVRGPSSQDGEVERLKKDSTLISFLYPAQNQDLVKAIAGKGVNAFAMDMIPRISRAQVFDALRQAVAIARVGVKLIDEHDTVLWLISLVIKLYWRLQIILEGF